MQANRLRSASQLCLLTGGRVEDPKVPEGLEGKNRVTQAW